MKVIIHLEHRDPMVPGKVSKPMDPEDALNVMREAVFRVAAGEYAAAYVTRENPIKFATTRRAG